MARVKIEDVIEHLRSEMRRALADAMNEVAPQAQVDPYNLFRAFKRAVRRKCNTWENVPSDCVDVD